MARYTKLAPSSFLVLLVGLLAACAQPMEGAESGYFGAPDPSPEGLGGGASAPNTGVQGLPCQPCETSADCGGPDDLCIINSSTGGTFCAGACETEVDCPKDFFCIPIQGADKNQCVPKSGNCESKPIPGDPGVDPGQAGAGGGLPPDPGTGGQAGTGGQPTPGTGGSSGQPGTGGTGGSSGGGSGGSPGNPPSGINAMCFGMCAIGVYNECTCWVSDPCGWNNDGYCDDPCEQMFPNAHFDDGGDCYGGTGGSAGGTGGSAGAGGSSGTGGSAGTGGVGGSGGTAGSGGSSGGGTGGSGGAPNPCGNSCQSGVYDACTCGAGDACGWKADGYCDDACYAMFPANNFDDSADCGYWNGGGSAGSGGSGGGGSGGGSGGSPGTTSYTVTSVYDNLNANDANIVATGLANLGYAQQVRDQNVSTSKLKSYLSSEVTTLYHTGHGFDGTVVTSDGSVSSSGTTIRAQNSIFATCLTLSYSWSAAFGSSAQTVMGYTKVSYDGIDDTVAQSFVSQLGAGRSYVEAWYLANAGVGMLSDRWAAYVREGGSIVEYSARTGHKPMSGLDATWVTVGQAENLRVDAALLSDDRTYASMFASGARTQPVRGVTGFAAGGLANLAPLDVGAAEAVQQADAWLRANGGVPADASVDRVVPIESKQSSQSTGTVVGYMVRYGRETLGLRVRGNAIDHHIMVLVGAKGVIAWSRQWPAIASARPGAFQPRPMRVREAIVAAAGSIASMAKGDMLYLYEARPVFGVRGDGGGDLTPAYELRGTDGEVVVISALSGRPL